MPLDTIQKYIIGDDCLSENERDLTRRRGRMKPRNREGLTSSTYLGATVLGLNVRVHQAQRMRLLDKLLGERHGPSKRQGEL